MTTHFMLTGPEFAVRCSQNNKFTVQNHNYSFQDIIKWLVDSDSDPITIIIYCC